METCGCHILTDYTPTTFSCRMCGKIFIETQDGEFEPMQQVHNMTEKELEEWKRANPGTPLNPNPLDDDR